MAIHWSKLGLPFPNVRIDNDQAADAFVHFLECILEIDGESYLNKISQIPMGSSMLLSKNPKKDFRNPVSGDQYSFKQIKKTSWFVKTHSSTSQKVEQIEQIMSILKMPKDSVMVEIVEK